nr:aldehyde dehydrogenase family protein [Actinomycetes bacterium]
MSHKVTELLIDGELTAGRGGTFTTINPATEEPLGEAADATGDDMDRAVAAARRAFDESDWSRDVELRVQCLRQLR